MLALPFVFALILIAHNLFVLKRTYHFLLYGGEYINFEENENQNVLEIYNMLKEIKNNQSCKI
jgi:hypothetical protein